MKSRFDAISPRWIRVIYTVFAALVLAVTTYNFLHMMFWRVMSNDQCRWQQIFSDTTRVHVGGVEKGTSAAEAGLLNGDILLAIDSQPVKISESAMDRLNSVPPGDSLLLRIERDRRERTLRYARAPNEDSIPFHLFDRLFETLVITDIVEGGVTDQAGIEEGDILLRIDGISVNHSYGAQYLLNIHPAGSKAAFLVERDGRLLTLHVQVLKIFNYIYLAQFILGLGFLLVGYFVVMARPQGSIQRKFARFGIFAMLFFGLSSVVASDIYDPLWKVYGFLAVFLIARVLAPPVFISFFLHFPVRRPVVQQRWLMPVLYGIVLIAAFGQAVYVFRWFGFVMEWEVSLIFYYVPLLYFLVGLSIFLHSYYTRVEPEQRNALRPILQSIIIGVAAFIYTAVINTMYPFVIFLQPYLLLPSLLIVGIPPAFGYSIIKHRLMDVTVIVKRSIIYGVVTAIIAAIYLAVVFGLGRMLGVILGETDNQLWTLIAFVIIALLFDPLKQRVQRIVDRFFYRERYNYQKALLEFSSELPRQINLEQILNSVVNRISSTMHVDKVSVSLCGENNGCYVVSKNIPEELCVFSDSPGGVYELLERTRQPQSFALIEEDTRITDPADRQKIIDSDIYLMVPMFLQDKLLGAVNVGPKLSGSVYSQEDIDLLSTVAGHAAIALENARLHRSEINDQKIQEQLKIAQRIQQGLLPKDNPSNDRLDIDGVSIPAMTVGGDYYDYIELPGNRLLVAVGDVSGKGMSAALYMAKVQGMIRFAAQIYGSPREILSSVNRLIYEGMERNSFITMILALFDLDAGTVTMCRAGHTQPLVALNGDMRFLGSDGMGLGLEPGDIFDRSLEENVHALKPDGLILLYSDGLTEAMDVDMKEFGEERVIDLVRKWSHCSSTELKNHLIEAIVEHRDGAEQNDDITLVVIRVR
ncbi:MAG: SpoIIE family protein phosphatase [Bacteroidetes bacterium]|nr:SpoIIE family protein phosphatase [Bacteroidota bacterium]